MNIPLALKLKATAEANAILKQVDGVSAVVVATLDGFEIASASHHSFDPSSIAAMASSIYAIGGAVSREVRLGSCRSITVDTEDGFALVSPVRSGDAELVVNVIAGVDAVFAQVMYRTVACVKLLEET